jgi:hypothetical protein
MPPEDLRRMCRPIDLTSVEVVLKRLAPVYLVLLLAPVTAEYLIGYDDTIGNPAALIFGVVFFAPLYGAPAVLIREAARRLGRGWPTILLMATAFGLVEAGLVDQSLFNPDYRDIPYWSSMREPTFLPWFGTSAYMALTFVAGHVFGSIAAPIALAESWCPARRRKPWLGVPGLTTMAILWIAGSAFILADQFSSEDFRISTGQLASTALVALVLIAVAVRIPATCSRIAGRAPSPRLVLVTSAALLIVRSVVPTSWAGTLVAAAATGLWLVVAGRWSRQAGWTGVHVVAAVTGNVLSIGIPAFWTDPLGDVPLGVKLATNTALLGLVLAVATVGFRRERATLRLQGLPQSGLL